MLSAGEWTPNQPNLICFVLGNTSGEVSGLGTAFTLEISKNGGAFAAGAGTKAEIGSGWYSYLATDDEADTYGPVAIKITHASIDQQNLEYVVATRVSGALDFTYTVTENDAVTPIPDVEVEISTDLGKNRVVWVGMTNTFGIALKNGDKPMLAPDSVNPYYFWRRKDGFEFDDPDQEIVDNA